MHPIISFVLINRDGGPFDTAWRAIEAQELPADRLDVHVLSPLPGGGAPPVPVPEGESVVFLGAPVIPAPDLGALAHARLAEVDEPDRVILQGRASALDEVRDPISRRIIEGSWSDFSRVRDPENLPLHWLDPRCLAFSRALFARLAPLLLEHAFTPGRSRVGLGAALSRAHDIRLRSRPRLRVYDPTSTTIDLALEATRRESADRHALAAGDPRAASAFGIPPDEELLEGDPADLRRRVERLGTIARELSKLDLPRILGNEPPDVPIAAAIERLADDVLVRATDAAARMSWIVAARHAHEQRAGRAPESAPSLLLTPGTPPGAAPSTSSSEVALQPERAPELSVLIVTNDAAETLGECLAALSRHTDIAHEIVVVDNASIDESGEIARAHPGVRMVLPQTEPLGYAEAVNLGLRVTTAPHVVLLEPDAIVGPSWARAMLEAGGGNIGAIVPVTNGLPGAQSLVRWLDSFSVLDDVDAVVRTLAARAQHEKGPHPTRWIGPLAVALPRRVVLEVGGLDTRFSTADVALLALSSALSSAGKRIVIATGAFVARAGGLRPTTASALERGERSEEVDRVRIRADLTTLRSVIPALGSARSRELWGVDWTGYDEGLDAGTDLSIVIPVCNQLDFTKACLDSIRSGSVNDAEIVVVDNGSTDGTGDYLAARGDVVVVSNDTNRGFAPAVNQGLERSSGGRLLVLNNDTILPSRMIARLCRVLQSNPSYAMIGPVTNFAAPSQQVDASYEDVDDLDAFAEERWRRHGERVRPEPVVLGFAMLMRREVYDTVGGFDERFEVGNFEDNDFSLRATVAGYRLGVADGVYVHHFGGRTFAGEGFDYAALMRTNHARFVDKWQKGAPTSGEIPEIDPDPSLAHPDTVSSPGWLSVGASGGAAPAEPGDRVAGATTGDAIAPSAPLAVPVAGSADGEAATGGREPKLAPGDIYLVANDRLENGRFSEAEELFVWTIELMPEMVLAHMGHGLALARLGRLEEAASALEHTVRLEPTLSEGYNNLGVVYYMMGRHERARQALERAAALDPENGEASTNLEEISSRIQSAARAGA